MCPKCSGKTTRRTGVPLRLMDAHPLGGPNEVMKTFIDRNREALSAILGVNAGGSETGEENLGNGAPWVEPFQNIVQHVIVAADFMDEF